MEPVVYTPVSAKANLRRSTIIGVAVAAVGIALCTLEGHPVMGIFGLVGILLGALNNLMLQKAVIAYASTLVTRTTKRRFRGGVAMRLGAITVVSLGLAILMRPDGLGIFVGLAVFQVLMLVGAALPVFRSLRPSA